MLVNSHGVVGNELPHEPFVVTELRVGVGAQVFEGVVRVAIVPKVGILRPGVSDTSAFIGGHPSESWPAPRRMCAVIAAGVVVLLLDSDAVLSRANRRVADRADRLLGEWGLIRFHLKSPQRPWTISNTQQEDFGAGFPSIAKAERLTSTASEALKVPTPKASLSTACSDNAMSESWPLRPLNFTRRQRRMHASWESPPSKCQNASPTAEI